MPVAGEIDKEMLFSQQGHSPKSEYYELLFKMWKITRRRTPDLPL